MQYQSTRDKNLKASSAHAILNGLAPDGGLYTMPSFDEVKFDYTTVLNMDTMSMSTKILSKLLPDFSEAEMAKLVHDGYTGKFETDHLTPTVPVGEDFILELFRGPTSAFKDVALSMLPRLMTASKEKLGVDDEIMILTATSGDTGKAAMEGFCDVPGTKIIVFYPHGGVSAVQQAQMATQAGENVCVCAVRGNFDDAQTGVKKIFSAVSKDQLLEGKGVRLSSANSINIGRLAPQVVYYYRAYADLVQAGRIQPGDKVDYVVPTGVRIGDADRVRLGAHLSEGTTVMHAGFVNFNAGTLGVSMVEGRVSQGVVVGNGSDIGGGACIMGTLSGGGKLKNSIGEHSLLGANAGIGISLGDNCVVEAGLYVTAGTKVTIYDKAKVAAGEPLETVKGAELSGKDNILFIRNSVSGRIEARYRKTGIELNEKLHKN